MANLTKKRVEAIIYACGQTLALASDDHRSDVEAAKEWAEGKLSSMTAKAANGAAARAPASNVPPPGAAS